jgi:zinc transporter
LNTQDIYTSGPPEEDGLIFACRLDGEGSAKLLNWQAVEDWTEEDGPIWLHLDRSSARVRKWLSTQSGLTQSTAEALLADETRPRIFHGKRGYIAILRGINLNPGAEPEEMVSLRIWSEGKRIITLRQRRLMTPRVVLHSLIETGNGPKSISEMFERLIFVLNERMSPVIAAFDEKLDDLETHLDPANANQQRRELSDIRQEAVLMRRYLAPQREALGSLQIDAPAWLEDTARAPLRETADRLTRYVEELDAARERSMIIKDDIANQLAESANRTLYVLAIISGIFLPLAFLTGLLGINIGGMPGVDNPSAFWLFCVMIVVLLVFELILFKRLKWL